MSRYKYSRYWFNKGQKDFWDKHWHNQRCPTDLKCLEVGCFEGQASVWILENLVGERGSFYAIDFFHKEEMFDNNIKTANKEHLIKKIKGDAVVEMSALLKKHESTFDFIYIDASKLASENCFALLIAERLLSVGGKIVVDDFLWPRSYGADPRESPRLGVILFEQMSLLCQSVKPPSVSQYSFQKVRETNYFIKSKAEL